MSAPVPAGESVICLGTSPAMLFEGLRRARGGAKVTFLDRAEAIGGGWRTRDLFGFTGVEVGAHLFENRPDTLALLRSVLRQEELAVDEAGSGLFGTRRIPLRAARALLYGGLTAKAAARRDREGLAHSARNLAAAAAGRKLPLVYPQGGVAPLLARLFTLLEEAGATLRFGVEVARIEARGGCVAALLDEEEVRADRLILSSRAHAPVAGLEEHWAGLRRSTVESLVMLLDPQTYRFSGYVEVFSNPIIKRARRLDIVDDTGARPLAVFQLRGGEGDAAERARTVLAEAARLGLVKAGAAPLALHRDTMTYATLSLRLMKRIERHGGGRIEAIRTVDFSDQRPR